jgi:hypothetical protein
MKPLYTEVWGITFCQTNYILMNAVFWGVAPCRYDPLKRRFNRPHLHGATPQKTAFFIVTAVKTSNPTNYILLIVGVTILLPATSELFVFIGSYQSDHQFITFNWPSELEVWSLSDFTLTTWLFKVTESQYTHLDLEDGGNFLKNSIHVPEYKPSQPDAHTLNNCHSQSLKTNIRTSNFVSSVKVRITVTASARVCRYMKEILRTGQTANDVVSILHYSYTYTDVECYRRRLYNKLFISTSTATLILLVSLQTWPC